MLGQRQRLLVNIETASGECHVFADVLAQSIQQTQCWITVVERSRQLTGIEPVMGCDAGQTLNRNWVCRPTSSVRGTS